MPQAQTAGATQVRVWPSREAEPCGDGTQAVADERAERAGAGLAWHARAPGRAAVVAPFGPPPPPGAEAQETVRGADGAPRGP